MRIAEPWVIRFLNATGADWLSSRHACFSVSFSPHPNHNARDTLLLLNMKVLCTLQVEPFVRFHTQCSSHIFQCELIESRGSQLRLKVPRYINFFVSEIKQDHPLNLSISLSGGKEINKDCPSNGEWSGKSPNWKSSYFVWRIVIYRRIAHLMEAQKFPRMGRQRGWQPRMWCHYLTSTLPRVGLFWTAALSGR